MAQISELEPLRGHRIRVVLDSGERYQLLASALDDRPLAVGQEVDPAEFSHWVLLRQYRAALDRAVAALARRNCSKGEIERLLRRGGYAEETVDMVLLKLEKNGLLNDSAFADQWVRYRAGQKYGPRKIQQELRGKGVSPEDAEDALDIPEEEQLESALLLARKSLKWANGESDLRKLRQKALSGIVRRGFSWDLARQAVDQVLKEEGLDDF